MAYESGALQLSLHDSPRAMPLTRLSSVSEQTEQTERTERMEWGGTKRSFKYYIESGDVVFQVCPLVPLEVHDRCGCEKLRANQLQLQRPSLQVEETLFRVHRYFFLRESQLFRDMLSLPIPAPTEPSSSTGASKGKFKAFDVEGTSDDNPIHLPQVSTDEFEDFLWVFYNPCVTTLPIPHPPSPPAHSSCILHHATHTQPNRTYSNYTAPLKTWSSILLLAHRWDFPFIRTLAFRELERPDNPNPNPVPPAARLVLGEKYDAPGAWRARALTELALRRDPLSREEGRELGVELVVQVSGLRERVARGGRGGRDRISGGWGFGYERSRSRSLRRRSRSRSRSRTPSPPPPPIVIPPPHPPVNVYIPPPPPPPSPPQPPNPWDWANNVPPFVRAPIPIHRSEHLTSLLNQ